MKLFIAIGLLLLGLYGFGCGKADEATDEADPASWARMEKAAGPDQGRLLIPEGSPPNDVVAVDLERGHGPTLKRGDWFSVNYVAFNYETGKVREDWWRGKAIFSYTYGIGETVKGWEKGLKGLRPGGVRELVVPADLAYGDEALVYLIKNLKIENG